MTELGQGVGVRAHFPTAQVKNMGVADIDRHSYIGAPLLKKN